MAGHAPPDRDDPLNLARQALWAALVAAFGVGLGAETGWPQGLVVAFLVAILGYMVERGRTQR